MPYPSALQLVTVLPWIRSATVEPEPALSVWTPEAESVTVLLVNCVPFDQLAEMASLASETLLFAIVPAPPKLNMATDASSPLTFVTVLLWKLNVPPLEAYRPRR